MSNDKEYNGWTNWETWNVALWVDNDYETYKRKQRFVMYKVWGRRYEDLVEEFCNEEYPNGTPDMDNSSEMRKVNYQEIADAWKEEYELEFEDE